MSKMLNLLLLFLFFNFALHLLLPSSSVEGRISNQRSFRGPSRSPSTGIRRPLRPPPPPPKSGRTIIKKDIRRPSYPPPPPPTPTNGIEGSAGPPGPPTIKYLPRESGKTITPPLSKQQYYDELSKKHTGWYHTYGQLHDENYEGELKIEPTRFEKLREKVREGVREKKRKFRRFCWKRNYKLMEAGCLKLANALQFKNLPTFGVGIGAGYGGRIAAQTLLGAAGFAAAGPVGAVAGAAVGGFGAYITSRAAKRLTRGIRKNYWKKQLPWQENFKGWKMYLDQMRQGKTGRMLKKTKSKNLSKLFFGGGIEGLGLYGGKALGTALGAMTGIPFLDKVGGFTFGVAGSLGTEFIGEGIAVSPLLAAKKLKNWKSMRNMRQPGLALAVLENGEMPRNG